MGRRPNPLMAEFFERGAKISDMSNRYEQTCKRCNERFPKGRNEAMVPHLTRKCPAISQKERAKIIFRLHDLALPDLNPYIDPNYVPEVDPMGAPAQIGNISRIQNVRTAATESQNQLPAPNGLDALAEASLQVGRNEQDTGYSYGLVSEQVDLPSLPLDPQLPTNDFPDTTTTTLPMTIATSIQSATAPISTNFYFNPHGFASGDPFSLTDLPLVVTSALDFPSMTATAHGELFGTDMVEPNIHADMSDQLHQELQESDITMVDQTSFPWPTAGPAVQTQATLEELMRSAQANATLPVALRPPRSQRTRSTATKPKQEMAPASAGLDGQRQRPTQRNRGAYAPERRSEVREVRKLGACLRCRVLRKPCSAGTPCDSCAPLQNPRLHKMDCMREKLEDQLRHYSAMPYTVLANCALDNLKEKGTFAKDIGVLETSHLPGHKILFKTHQVTMNVALNPANSGAQLYQGSEVIVLAIGSDNVLPKIEQYLQAVTVDTIEKEESPVMRASLQIAHELREHKKQSNALGTKTEGLLGEAIELWVATVLITDNHLKPTFAHVIGTESDPTSINEIEAPNLYWLLIIQLRAAIEKRASILCRNALHHLSQRIIIRNHGVNFETFLIVFIILNCAERMQWMYQRWALPDESCPLGDPQAFVDEANASAQYMLQLLEIRKMEPHVTEDPETGSLVARKSEDTTLTKWLALAGFTSDFAAHFGPRQFNPADSRSLDGTFTSLTFNF